MRRTPLTTAPRRLVDVITLGCTRDQQCPIKAGVIDAAALVPFEK